MIAVDTNVLVRIITNDDPAETQRAIQLLGSNTIWISRTVLLELVWVLKSKKYALPPQQIIAHVRALASNGAVQLESPDHVRCALDWYATGMDFADALHLAAAAGTTEFAT